MPYSYKEIKKKLEKLGYVIVRQKWSHVIFSNWNITIPVPKHWWKDISPWVEKNIIKILKLDKSKFKSI